MGWMGWVGGVVSAGTDYCSDLCSPAWVQYMGGVVLVWWKAGSVHVTAWHLAHLAGDEWRPQARQKERPARQPGFLTCSAFSTASQSV